MDQDNRNIVSVGNQCKTLQKGIFFLEHFVALKVRDCFKYRDRHKRKYEMREGGKEGCKASG